jgi:hypothetical protein
MWCGAWLKFDNFEAMDANTFVILYGSAATGQAGPPPPVFDPTYQLILDAMTAQGIPQPTEPQKQKQNGLVVDLKSALGDWDRIKSLRVYAGTNQQAALLDWKRYFVMTAFNAPAHSEALGFTGNGTSARIDTGFTPDVSTPSGTILGYFTQLGALTSRAASGALSVNNNRVTLLFAPGLFPMYGAVSNSGADVITAPQLGGFTRISATQGKRLAGATITPVASNYDATAVSSLFDLCQNGAGTAQVFWDGSLGLGMILDTVTDVEYQAVRTAIDTYMTP